MLLPRLRALCVIVVGAVAAAIAVAAPASAATTWSVDGPPGGAVSATLRLDDGGRLAFGVALRGAVVLAPSPVGVILEGADLSVGLTFGSRTDRTLRERYTMTTGKRLVRDTALTESTFAFTGAGGTRIDVVVRVSAEGAAYRYVLPSGGTVLREASAYTLPVDAPAWLLPYSANYEDTRVRTTAGAATARDYGYPSLFRVGADYVLLTESDVDGRYSGARLTKSGSSTFTVKMDDARISATGTLTTPWRVAVVGGLGTVTTSTLVDDLAPPTRLADTSWVRPGTVAWSWLSEHASPGDPVRQRQYVDFAARNGWPYVLVDEGWSAEWVPELVRYARARGVEVLLWLHWSALDTAAERDTLLPRLASWGVAGVKLDFMDSDAQARWRWYDAILPATAANHLMVNFHGATIPRGTQRTWPHVMTFEAVRGAEQMRTRATTNAMFPFTRNVVGGMDYTPVTWSVTDRDTTDAHEVALAVVYESGWQHLADRPEQYDVRPEALRTLSQLPTVWDETRFVAGEPGTEAVLARRGGDRWFVGGISAAAAHTVAVPLGFLGDGRFLAETLRDGDHGLVRETRIVRAGDTLAVPERADGGFVTVLCAYTGVSTCDRPLRRVPATTLSVTPAEAQVRAGDTVEVTATFVLPSGGPLTDVRLAPAPPGGWTVSGAAVTAATLDGGESLTGTWRVTVPAGVADGAVDLPVVATYAWADRPVHVEQAVRVLVAPTDPDGTPYVSDLPFLSASNGFGPVERDRSNGEDAAGDGKPLTMDGAVHAKGLGTHAPSEVTLWLGGACTRFTALVGIDDEVKEPGSVEFQVNGDGRALGTTGVLRSADAPRAFTVDVTGVRELTLRVTDGGDGKNFDHADWAEAILTC
jgi:alpha-glucosidase